MNYIKKESIFDKFFSHRDLLIMRFADGDISKKEYIIENMEFIKNLDVKPFKNIDSFEKGIYNYQYFNMLAKYYYMEAKELKDQGEPEKYYQSFHEEGYYYYQQKDKCTLELLKFLKFSNMEAYYIDVESDSLHGKLYEINLKDFDKAILHSKNYKILDILRKKGVFVDNMQKSLIDRYVNVKY
ncbi:hypothetical protein GOQ29_13200 [Clostridium sp. D2Q-14]|uniref:DUF6648 family protein n=1 Tax=Anaeromonas gelatinilytica TaxID=2683194 RepID=UPI00193B4105|nr:DUF6648 family protein [Anaeromonas gelatinilytica]MBS4536575.1 hypothetical protein [Anaeromonas gelatinilytica]